ARRALFHQLRQLVRQLRQPSRAAGLFAAGFWTLLWDSSVVRLLTRRRRRLHPSRQPAALFLSVCERSKSLMPKITRARVIVTCPGRNFVTLKIETDAGVHGVGDATLNGRELAVASYLTDHVIPCLIGRDAHCIEDTWQFLYRGAYW